MKPKLKIALSVGFVCVIIFVVVKGFFPADRTRSHVYDAPRVLMKPPPKSRPQTLAKKTAAKPVVKHGQEPMMAIILDDWGKNYSALEPLLELDRPVTLAILPNLVHSRRIAEEAHARGLGIMLHMPMEPTGKYQPLEPQTIKVDAPETEIVRYLNEAIRSIPHLEGVNNHMGSAATSSTRVMRVVMKELKKKNLFFIDSNVVSTTQGWRTAAEMGVSYAKRDVFIDNEPDVELIKKQLAKAQKIALMHGQVVVIGHDKKITIHAIREMIPEFEKAGIRMVLARELVDSESMKGVSDEVHPRN